MVISSDPSSSTFDNLELAGRLVDVVNKNELQPFDIAFKMDLRRSDVASLSGLTDSDYVSHDGFRDVVQLKTVPIPQELLDQFSQMRCNCAMGLIGDVSRAWFSVDNDLYIWNYETCCDLAYYDKLEHSVLQACLVPVKKDMFQVHIHKLMAVITPVDLVLLAVNFADSNGQSVSRPSEYHNAEMHLLPDAVFKVSLDGLLVSDVKATSNGRIFLAGRDSCLYEIQYNSKSWFGSECKKINQSKGVLSYMVPSFLAMTFGQEEPLAQIVVDDSRNILFTRSEKGSIQVFDLGSNCDSCSQIGHLSAGYMQEAATRASQSIEPSNFRPVIHLQAVESSESRVINLIATTQAGVRLYFTCYYTDSPTLLSSPTHILTKDQCRPQTLRLLHVRLPPGFAATSYVNRPTNTHLSLNNGNDLCSFITMAGETQDIAWFLNTVHNAQPHLSESLSQYQICGRTWDFCDGTSDVHDYFTKLWQKMENSFVALPLPAVTTRQHLQQSRKIIVLTAQAIQTWLQLRPVDVLKNVLLEYGPESKQTNAFFKLYQTERATSMCILLACSKSTVDVADRAMRAYFAHSGQAEFMNVIQPRSQPFEHSIGNISTQIGSPALASTPVQSPVNYAHENLQHMQQSMQQEHAEVRFSAAHNALYAHYTRIVGPLWNMKIAEVLRGKTSEKQASSIFTAEELSWLCDQIVQYKNFFSKYQVIPAPMYAAGDSRARGQNQRQHQVEALTAERQSLLRLHDLVCMSCEVLQLWKILVQHDFSAIMAQLPTDLYNLAISVNFRQLVVQGKDLCADLITCLIRHYLSDEARTDTICERLREACPSLFTHNDALIAKASEFLQNATREESPQNKAQLIAESVRLFKKVANQIHLHTVVKQFEQGLFFVEIVDLSLCTAEKLDPENLASLYLQNMDDTTNVKLEQAYLHRLSCYKCITEALDRLVSPHTWHDTKITPQLAEIMSEQMIKDTIHSGDYLCHVTLFQWMLDKGLDEKLLHIPSEHVELFLKNGIAMGGNQALRYLDLLCKLLEKSNNYLAAAKMLIKMAESPQTSLDLDNRLKYITRACMCAKSVPISDSPGLTLFIQQLQDKLEIGRLQKQILCAVVEMGMSNMTQECISQLNAQLFDVSTLYERFAERFNLSQCKLSIIHCAGHEDAELVTNIWNEIIEHILRRNDQHMASNETKLNKLKMKLIELANIYASTPKYYPQTFLTGKIYVECSKLGAGTDWLSNCLTNCGIDEETQVQVLMQLYKNRQNNRLAQTHLMATIAYAINQFVSEASRMDPLQRRKIANRLLDVTSYFLVELDAMPVDQQFTTHKSSFKALQIKIQKLA